MSALVSKSLLLTIIILLSFSSCAMPVAETDTAGFIPDRELQIVSLTREGLAYYQQSRFVDAELKLRQALYLAPDADNIKANLGVTLGQNGQFEEASAILLKLTAKYPLASKHIVNLAEMYARQRKYDLARQAFKDGLRKAIQRGDISALATIERSLSVVEFRSGNEEEALCHSGNAVVINADPQDKARHARMLIAANWYGQAETFIENILNVDRGLQQNPDILRHLAQIKYSLGKFTEAYNTAQRGREILGVEPEVDFDLKLVMFLAKQKLPQDLDMQSTQQALGLELEDNDETRELLFGQQLSDFQELYWPLNLIADYKTEHAKLTSQ